MAVTSAVTPTTTAASVASATTSKASLAKNFDTFLTLLTTQLKNQNPLEPLDTNQFTQQLVQFAQVEQQIDMNQQMTTLIAVQKAAQTSSALNFLGTNVAISGATAALKSGKASWTLNPANAAAAAITIKDSTGQTIFTETRNLTKGSQSYNWNGRDNKGNLWADGDYTIAVTAKDSNGQTVAVSTEVQGVVNGVDLTQDPPLLQIGTQTFPLSAIKRVIPAT